MIEIFNMKTQVFMGETCVIENKEIFKKLGKKAAIVTSKHAGKLSGAMRDVMNVLDAVGVSYCVIDTIESNPDLDLVLEASRKAFAFGASYIIGIGGGSPMDAAKAVAMLCNNKMVPMELFNNDEKYEPLPIICIPTTSGTGSEVTPYSIITRHDKKTKKSFKHSKLFPTYAFLDYRYTKSLSKEITIDTAIDAFTHAFEGYVSKRSTRTSDILAKEAIKIFFKNISAIKKFEMTKEVREDLLYMSMLAGMVISQTGTTCLHAMGYSLTYFKGISHGRANGILLLAYIDMIKEDENTLIKLESLINEIKIGSFSKFKDILKGIVPKSKGYTREEINEFVDSALFQSSIKQTPIEMTEKLMTKLYEDSL